MKDIRGSAPSLNDGTKLLKTEEEESDEELELFKQRIQVSGKMAPAQQQPQQPSIPQNIPIVFPKDKEALSTNSSIISRKKVESVLSKEERKSMLNGLSNIQGRIRKPPNLDSVAGRLAAL